MAEGIVVSILTMMGHASHLQWGVVMVQDSLGVVSNTGEVTDASMKTMMGTFAIVLHHQVLMVEIPLCVISMVVVTYVNILKTVLNAQNLRQVMESFLKYVQHMVVAKGVNLKKVVLNARQQL